MTASASAFRHIPNVLSIGRILATPVLVYLAITEREEPYKWLLLAAFLSDIADGLIARGFSLTSDIGSRLDSIADSLLWIPAIWGMWVFYPFVIADNWLIVSLIVGLGITEHIVALLRYGKLSSFHTYTNRVSAYGLGIFIMSVYLFGYAPWLLYAAATLNILGRLEQLTISALLPDYTSNVRGLYWVLQKRKVESA